MASSEKSHAWTRYWAPGNSPIPTEWGNEPYLLDPESLFGRRATLQLSSLEELTAEPFGCIVLCGEPGMGKTRTLERWLSEKSPALGENQIRVDFRQVPDRAYCDTLTFDSKLWRSWRGGWHNGGSHLALIIDGVDEGIIKIPGFVEYLVQRLKGEDIARLHLVIVCRSMDWPPSEGDRLLNLWPAAMKNGLFELCPLRRRDVENAAQDYGINADGFLSEIRREGLAELATRPLTLQMLCLEFKKHRRFSGSRSELIRRYIRSLCQEADNARVRRLIRANPALAKYTPDDIFRCARRIAVFMLLCGRSALRLGRSNPNQKTELSADEVTRSWPGTADPSPSPDLLHLTLQSPLFTTRGPDCAGFYHQVLAEVLAADFLAALSPSQQIDLLCHDDQIGRYIEPPLAEVAAWLAIDSRAFRAYVMEHEPAILLRADISGFSVREKAALVDRLIASTRAERLFDQHGERRYYQGLRHPGLAQQLRACISDRTANIMARRLALAIAASCRTHAVTPDVLSGLGDPQDTGFHSFAAPELSALISPAYVPKVAALLRAASIAPDQRRTRYWCAIALLKSKAWRFRQILHYAPDILGSSSGDSVILAQFSGRSDVKALLCHLLRWSGCFDIQSPFYGLAKTGFLGGLQAWWRPVIRKLLAKVWLAAVHDPRGLREELARSLRERCDAHPLQRRAFIEELAGLIDFDLALLHHLVAHIFHRDDIEWVLWKVCRLRGRRRRNFAKLARSVYQYERDAHLLGELLAARKAVPALAREFHDLRVWRLDDPVTQQARIDHARREAMSAGLEVEKTPEPEPEEVWRADLRILGSSPAHVWKRASYNLFRSANSSLPQEFESDVSKSPGWQFHNAAARKKLRAAARRFLMSYQGEPSLSFGSLSHFGTAAYQALFLLRNDLRRDPALAAAVKRHWIPTILNWFGQGNKQHLRLFNRVYQWNPRRAGKFLEAEMEKEALPPSEYILCVRKFAGCWDKHLRSRVIKWVLRHPQLRPSALGSLTKEVLEIDAETAWQLWRKVSQSIVFRRRHKAAVLGAWLGKKPWTIWPKVQAELAKTSFARAAFLVSANGHDITSHATTGNGADPICIADAYLRLRRLFPRIKDEPTPQRSFTPSPRMEIARWRDGLPQALATQGTLAACQQLERIAAKVSGNERLFIRMKLQEAVEAKRRRSWQPITPTRLAQKVATS